MEGPWAWAALAAVGVVAGVINTLAGGGSLLTLPLLMFAGLPAGVANGTNRVGVLLGSVVAAIRFRREPGLDARVPLVELVPAVLGALVGSWLSVDVDEALFRRIVGVALLGMLALLLARPSAWLVGRAHASPRWARVLGFAAIGLYGGFLQAGVGMFLLAGAVLLSGTDLVVANARKVVHVAIFTVPALAVFVAADQVRWPEGLALAAGTTFGSWLGARWTVAWGPGVLRAVLVAVVLVSSSRLLGVW